jgi:hypothetical protein
MWEERELFLNALDRLPQIFCHRDANWRNLFSQTGPDGKIQTVAIDWAETGTGAIGEEIVPLVGSSIVFGKTPIEHAPNLDKVAFDSYLAGLHDAGWLGDPQIVRYAYTAAIALHYSIKALDELLWLVRDENEYAECEQQLETGRPIGEIMDIRLETRRFLLGLADEARALQNSLSI